MHTRFSGKSSPLLFDPEIEKTARQNLLHRSALKGKSTEVNMDPPEVQSTQSQTTQHQEPVSQMPPMPPPPYPTHTQTQQASPMAPISSSTTQPTAAPTGEFHILGSATYPLETRIPPQPNPLRAVHQPNVIPHPNRSGGTFEPNDNRARADVWDDGYEDEVWAANEGQLRYRGGIQHQEFYQGPPRFQQRQPYGGDGYYTPPPDQRAPAAPRQP
mgnify:CR=1 FL=1